MSKIRVASPKEGYRGRVVGWRTMMRNIFGQTQRTWQLKQKNYPATPWHPKFSGWHGKEVLPIWSGHITYTPTLDRMCTRNLCERSHAHARKGKYWPTPKYALSLVASASEPLYPTSHHPNHNAMFSDACHFRIFLVGRCQWTWTSHPTLPNPTWDQFYWMCTTDAFRVPGNANILPRMCITQMSLDVCHPWVSLESLTWPTHTFLDACHPLQSSVCAGGSKCFRLWSWPGFQNTWQYLDAESLSS